MVITNSYPITGLPTGFKVIGRGYAGPMPVPVIIMIVCYVIGFIVLKYTKYGRSAYAIGGNIDAARISGLPVERNKVLIYILCGVTAAMAGIILASRMFSGQPSAGTGLELDAIAACVIGGTSTTGGKGRSAVFTTDCAPQWAPPEFCNWSNYNKLFQNIAGWLMKY
ncbi:ABC transporter permease [Clostridium sp. C105KSO13]|uniref:ABC transporter permease n=1 Tax=Clostridium sp. C105KSO13 TaxID=1776045 RepID=UPI0007408987|nr:ABC transporter permease [Clostridium sp. C105KSO13]CUX22648.1 Ribose transport system permease protein RbsC [Clostridium sp. C105KSO13]